MESVTGRDGRGAFFNLSTIATNVQLEVIWKMAFHDLGMGKNLGVEESSKAHDLMVAIPATLHVREKFRALVNSKEGEAILNTIWESAWKELVLVEQTGTAEMAAGSIMREANEGPC